MRRACVSVPANIAEGCGRAGDAELCRFLQIALGSTSELEYHLFLAKEVKLMNAQDFEALGHNVDEVRRMLIALIKKLKIDNPVA